MRIAIYVSIIWLIGSGLSHAAVKDEYSALKVALTAEVDQSEYPVTRVMFIPPNNDGDPVEISVGPDDCGAYQMFLGTLESKPGKNLDLAVLALRIVELEKYLKITGLPKNDVQDALTKFEENVIGSAGTTRFESTFKRNAKNLVKLLNIVARRTEKIALKFREQEGECGAGEVEVKIQTAPEGGSVYLIPTFFFKSCKLRNVDPDDRKQCDGWLEIVSSTAQLSGIYNYVVEWKDGSSKEGTFSCRGCEYDQLITFGK